MTRLQRTVLLVACAAICAGSAQAQTLSIGYPQTGDTLAAGDSIAIWWTATGSVGQLNVFLSIDNGQNYHDVTGGSPPMAADSMFHWIVEDSASTQCLLRIEDYSNQSVYDVAGPFSIVGGPSGPSIVLSASNVPCGGDTTFQVGVTNGGSDTLPDLNVSDDAGWLTVGIDNSPTNAATVTNTVDVSGLSDGFYQATVSVSGSGVTTRVYRVSLTLGTASGITVSSPTGGASFVTGDTVLVQWLADSTVSMVSISFSGDGGESWTPITESGPVPGSDGTYPWIVSASLPGIPWDSCLVRVADYNLQTTYGLSGVFGVAMSAPGPIIGNLPSPITVSDDTTFEVTVTNTGTDTLPDLSVVDDASWLVVSVVNASGDNATITNTVDTAGIAQGYYRATVTLSGTGVDSRSYAVNLALGEGAISFYNPLAGDTMVVGDTVLLVWSADSVLENPVLELTADLGENWTTISQGDIGMGDTTYVWPVSLPPPHEASANCQVRLSDYTMGTEIAVSGRFTIVGGAQLGPLMALSPGSFLDATMDTTLAMHVTNGGSGTLPTVSADENASWLEVSVDNSPVNGATVMNTFTVGSLSDGYYSETVTLTAPGVPTVTYTCRLTVGSPDPIVVSEPAGGETLAVDDTVVVRWSADPAVHDALIEVTTDDGDTWQQVTSKAIRASMGSFVWIVSPALTGLPSSACRIRVRDYLNVTTFGETGTFSIGQRPVMSLNPASLTFDTLFAKTVTVSNVGTGTLSGVAVAESASWLTVAIDSATANVAYLLNTVDTAGLSAGLYTTTVTVTATDASSRSYSVSLSHGTVDAITVTQPAGSESLQTGDTVLVRWSYDDSTLADDGMVLELTTDDGDTWERITTTGSVFGVKFQWAIPHALTGLPSSTCRVRVSSYATSTIRGESGTFSLAYGDTATVLEPRLYLPRSVFPCEGDTTLSMNASNVGTGTLPALSAAYDSTAGWLAVSVDNSPANGAVITTTVNTASLGSGEYSMKVYLSGSGLSTKAYTVNLNHNVAASPVPTSIVIAPAGVSCMPGDTVDFTAIVLDQYGDTVLGEDIVWQIAAGAGTISTGGRFISSGVSGSYQVTASIVDPEVSRTAAVHVIPYPLSLVSPNGGEAWQQGQEVAIEWAGDDSLVQSVHLSVSADGGVTWHAVTVAPVSRTDSSWGSFRWTVPTDFGGGSSLSEACLFAVRTVDAVYQDVSDGVFEIVAPVSATVDKSGGTVELAEVAAVEVPENARKDEDLSEPIEIVQTRTSIAPPSGFQLEGTGDVFLFLPHGTEFDTAVVISLPYTGAKEDVVIMRRSDDSSSAWEVITDVWFDDAGAAGMVFFRTTTFSVYGVSYKYDNVDAQDDQVPAAPVAVLPLQRRVLAVRAVGGALIVDIPPSARHTVGIFGLDGRLVRRMRGTGSVRYMLPTGTLPAASYVVRVQCDGAVVTRSVRLTR